MRVRSFGSFLLLGFLAAACATAPKPEAPTQTVEAPAPAEAPEFTLRAASFAELPGWAGIDAAPALAAFTRSCGALKARADDAPFARFAPYGGRVADWRAACAAAQTTTDPAAARAFFETHFQPHAVEARADQMRKVTGYYEPVIAVRAAPGPGFTEPFLARPDDLVGIDLAAFDEAQGLAGAIAEDVRKGLSNDMAETLKADVEEGVAARLKRRFVTPIWGQLGADRRVRPYPERGALGVDARPALAYAHPADVYDVQVQGSARVRFEDGRALRMAYDSQNGWRWSSAWACLRDRGLIAAADKRAARAWMDGAGPVAAREALNCDPSYVFFALEEIADPALGPKGAQGVPLTPLGSIAVDPAAHPYGAVLFLAGEGPGADGALGPRTRLLVAQDTGGAIRRGPLRGDIFYGTGDAAGALALRQNAEARFWTLLPHAAAQQVAAR